MSMVIYLLCSNMQVIGWSMWFSEYLFLERNWAKDESTLKVWDYGLLKYNSHACWMLS